MPTNDGNRGPRLRFVPFFPFLFLGVLFVGAHGTLTIALSLIASALLTVGISFMIARRQRRRHERILQRYESKEALIPTDILRRVERDIRVSCLEGGMRAGFYAECVLLIVTSQPAIKPPRSATSAERDHALPAQRNRIELFECIASRSRGHVLRRCRDCMAEPGQDVDQMHPNEARGAGHQYSSALFSTFVMHGGVL